MPNRHGVMNVSIGFDKLVVRHEQLHDLATVGTRSANRRATAQHGRYAECIPRTVAEVLPFADLNGELFKIEYDGTPCTADVILNGTVDVSDMLQVLADWGQTCVPADIDNDGVVAVTDLLDVLAAWGPCQ